MAAKIVVFLALLAFSSCAATAFVIPQCSSPLSIATRATIPQYFSPLTTVGSAHSFAQSYRQQQAFTTSILPSAGLWQQPSAGLWQQPLAFPHQIQAIVALQQQVLLSYLLNQLAVANPANYWQQQQLLPFNQLAVANPALFLQQQQQLLPFNQLATAAFLQRPVVGGAFC